MLKAVVTSLGRDASPQVVFETQVYGRTSHECITVAVPCASREHAMRVAEAYNGVAFTEARNDAADALAFSLQSALNHHGEPIAGGMSRKPDPQYRGAPMGVGDYTAPDVTPQDALHFGIRRVALDEGGYAPDGIYWGLPRNNLWHAYSSPSDSVLVSRWFREPSYAHAVVRIRAEFANATTQRVS